MTKVFEIAVIGGGPKSVALAAKAAAMRQLGLGEVAITIFECKAIGNNWTGNAGYTDGKQLLCTPIERDLGFPYESMFGKLLDAHMYSNYSWASFNIASSQSYAKWVDMGRASPSHATFAEYLKWGSKKSGAKIVKAFVRGVAVSDEKWEITCARSLTSGATVYPALFDGVVVTGPGPAKGVRIKRTPSPKHSDRIFDGSNFWTRLSKVQSALDKHNEEIVVIGGGGTGAAVLAWLVRNGYHDREMRLIADQATLFSRGDSVFENRLFSDEDAWKELSVKNREHFFTRLNRGVVWNTIMEDLSVATKLVFVDARARLIDSSKPRLQVLAKKEGRKKLLVFEPSIVIDASGFDAWWFVNLLSKKDGLRSTVDLAEEELKLHMTPSLKLYKPSWGFPSLHAPMLSNNVGPGFGSLMALGGMSDRIIGEYVAPPVPGADEIPDA